MRASEDVTCKKFFSPRASRSVRIAAMRDTPTLPLLDTLATTDHERREGWQRPPGWCTPERLGPLMIATHYKLGELAFTNLFEDRTPEFKAMNPFNKCPVLKDGDFVIAESSACLPTPSSPKCRARR